MTACVSLILGCLGNDPQVVQTMAHLQRQDYPNVETVVVLNAEAVDIHRDELVKTARSNPQIRLVVARSQFPGAVWNAGVRASRGVYTVLVDVGDHLGRRYIGKACARLEEHPDLAFVTCWVESSGVTAPEAVRVVPRCDLPTVLGRTGLIPRSSMVRRSVWDALGGFDESLVALEDYEFWIRVLQEGYTGAVLPEPLIRHPVRPGSPYRRHVEQEVYRDGMASIVRKHEAVFAREVTVVLETRERILQGLHAAYGPLVSRRDAAATELTLLEDEIGRLTTRLESEGRAGVDFGDLKRTSPISQRWGWERGQPVDRYYIEAFLTQHACDIRGRVLEVQDSSYTTRFGGDRVEHADVVDIDPTNADATIVADLRRAAHIPDSSYDCAIFTQTLHVIDDMRAVVAELVRILRPGGVLLATLPCASRVCLEYGTDGDFWRVTEAGVRALFSQFFPREHLDIRSYGNVLVTTAFLYGLAAQELPREELETMDPYFPLLVSVRAVRPDRSEWQARQGDGDQ